MLAAALSAILFATCAVAATAAGPLPGAVSARCPRQTPEALPADAPAGATRAALAEASTIYKGLDLHGERATQAVLAPFDSQRGAFASRCGALVHARTVVVYLEFPAERPSSSLTHGVVLVARFRGVFRVWAVLH